MRTLALVALLAAVYGATAAAAHEGHTTGPHPSPTAALAPAGASHAPTGSSNTPPGASEAAPAASNAAPLPPQPVLFRVRPEARADLGWTGISHGADWPAEQRLGFVGVCKAGDDTCAAAGGKAGDFFGSPVPLSSGGIPACIVNRLRESVRGSVQPKLGCAQLQLQLNATVFTGEDLARPCPVCQDDRTPNDGKRDGTCAGGATNGEACDAHGVTQLFGAVSNDCLPAAGRNVGELVLDLPLTTGDATMRAALTCKAATGKDAARCFCPAQVQANACVGGQCGPNEQCDEGPIDGHCRLAPGRSCRPGSGREDCETLQAGTGECITNVRSCFRETLPVSGKCDVERPTYAAAFCVPATRAAALNAAAGLPGPARVVLPLERITSTPAR